LSDEVETLLPDFRSLRHLVPPRDRFWADPFPVFSNGKYYIFLEEYLYSRHKAHIAVLELAPDGERTSSPVIVLERDYHLSYPCVFEWQGAYYMVPETVHNRTVELYRARSFPYAWELQTTLLEDVQAVDTTLTESGGRWWMFTNIAWDRASKWSDWNDELHLFHAPSPLGPWTPHRGNPVKSDVRSSRPAGRLFTRGGDLYRPAQDCSQRYGYAITINKILSLNTDEFREVAVAKILPNWSANLVGTHTINSAKGLTVIDGRMLSGAV
jgi:hypothetical protein